MNKDDLLGEGTLRVAKALLASTSNKPRDMLLAAIEALGAVDPRCTWESVRETATAPTAVKQPLVAGLYLGSSYSIVDVCALVPMSSVTAGIYIRKAGAALNLEGISPAKMRESFLSRVQTLLEGAQ